MSHYSTVDCEFKDQDALLEALQDLEPTWAGQIRVSGSGAHLYGYLGDIRPETAHIIIPRAVVGGSSNDIGFVRGSDGRYSAIISEFDSNRYDAAWLGHLKQKYATHVVIKEARRSGLRMVRQEDRADGSVRIVLEVQ